MIKICDAIMGSGKSSSAITYINEHPEKKYLYIAPYLDEASRIKEACPALKFIEPSDNIKDYQFSKARHTMALIERGKNVATTHQAVRYYTPETLELLRSQHYTVIIDEEINIFQQATSISDGDVDALRMAGLLTIDEYGCLAKTKLEYTGTAFAEIYNLLETRKVIRIPGSGLNPPSWYCIYPKEFLEAPEEVIVLTYLFVGSEMEIFLKMNGIDYSFIGIDYTDGVYRFCDEPRYIPEYTKTIHEKIHVLDNDKLNAIGNDRTAMSMAWYKKDDDAIDTLRKNIKNFFRHIVDKSVHKSSERLCGIYTSDKSIWSKLSDKGYKNSALAFNCKATNKFRDKTVVAYPVNLFPNVGIKLYYEKHGYNLDEDRFALSTMVQFIWRTAIRDGNEIWLYVPSIRMRTLLLDWMNNLSKGGVIAENV